jgi:TolA-binding protein
MTMEDRALANITHPPARVLVFASLLSAAVACSSKRGAPPGASEFKHARALVSQGRYADAIAALDTYLQARPRGAHASRAAFFLAKAKLGRGDIEGARAAFERTRREYPGSLEANKARYKLAFLLLLEGKRQDARAAFEALADHPDGPLAPEARAMAQYLSSHP